MEYYEISIVYSGVNGHKQILREKNGGDSRAQFHKTISWNKVRKCNKKTQRCELRTTNSRRKRFCETGRNVLMGG